MKQQHITQVDAFTGEPFSGNPAAVCIMEAPADEQWMQNVAKEMNLAETAFLYPENGAYRLRWFTPKVEVALCGHATLASAHVLWQDGHLPSDRSAQFDTLSGRLTASRAGEWITLDFPAKRAESAQAPPDLIESLGVRPINIVRNVFDFLVEVESADEVRSLEPDITRLAKVDMRGVIVTARSDDERYDFISRFFAPAAGVNEDPVTGSAHCALAPYWAEKLGRNELVGYQASDRGGIVRVQVRGDRVLLAGQAVTVLRGELVAR